MVFDDEEVKRSRTQEQRRVPKARTEAEERKREQIKLAQELDKAIKARDERAFSAALRRAGVRDGSRRWTNAWNAYRDYWK